MTEGLFLDAKYTSQLQLDNAGHRTEYADSGAGQADSDDLGLSRMDGSFRTIFTHASLRSLSNSVRSSISVSSSEISRILNNTDISDNS